MLSPARKIAAFLVILDCISVIFAFVTVVTLRGFDILSIPKEVFLIPLFLVIGALYLIDGYRPRTDMMGLEYTSQHAISILIAMVALLLVTFVFVTEDFAFKSSRGVILACFALLIPLTLSYRRPLYRRYLKRHGKRGIVFVGNESGCSAFLEESIRNKLTAPLIFAYINNLSSESACLKFPILPLSEVLDGIEAENIAVEAIVIRESNAALSADISQRLVYLHFHGISTYTLELFHQVYWRKIPIYRINPTWLFQEGFEITREPVFERIKRFSDILLSLVGLCIFSPFIVIGAVAIWLDDKGPIFFTQTRIGKNRVPFKLYKLRTMRVEAQEGDPYTREGDKRITRAGRLLRISRIDELPQILNVFKGDMSFIGPRAEWDRLVIEYEKQIPCYYFRHLVKPGITGWAQVNYPYGANIEDTLRKLEYDLYYIRHFSFVLDAAIILKTIHIMCFGKGR